MSSEPGAVAGRDARPASDGTPSTPLALVEAAIAALTTAAPGWAERGLAGRLDVLESVRRTTAAALPALLRALTDGHDTSSPYAPWDPALVELAGGAVPLARQLALLTDTMQNVATTGRSQPPAVREQDGRVVIDALPADRFDAITHRGYRAQVRLAAGRTLDDVLAGLGAPLSDTTQRSGGLALIIVAGRPVLAGALAAIAQLVVERRTVLLAVDPVDAVMNSHLVEALAPLVDQDLLRVVHTPRALAGRLAGLTPADAIHVIGDRDVHAAVRDTVASEARSGTVEVTADLPRPTPVVVVPGPWSDRDLAWQGEHLATMLGSPTGPGGAPVHLMFQHRAWSRRGTLLDAVRAAIRQLPAMDQPDAEARERFTAVTSRHPQAERFGSPGDHQTPITLIPEMDPADDDPLLAAPPPGPLLAELSVDAHRSVAAYLDEAVDRCNDQVVGAAAVTLLVHPRSLDDPEVARAVDAAIEQLAAPTVSLNVAPGAVEALIAPPGARAGSDTFLIGTGSRTLVSGPFRPPVTPPWFHTHAHALTALGRQACLTATGDAARLPRTIAAMLRA